MGKLNATQMEYWRKINTIHNIDNIITLWWKAKIEAKEKVSQADADEWAEKNIDECIQKIKDMLEDW